jgi:hypothetical protein
MLTRDFEVGDTVDVIDRRDGAVVERTTITKLEDEPAQPEIGHRGGWHATVAAGYRVSVRCLMKVKP